MIKVRSAVAGSTALRLSLAAPNGHRCPGPGQAHRRCHPFRHHGAGYRGHRHRASSWSPRSPGRSAAAARAGPWSPPSQGPAQVRTRTVRNPPDRPANRIPSSASLPVITRHPRSRMSTPAPQAGWTAPDGGRGAPPRVRPASRREPPPGGPRQCGPGRDPGPRPRPRPGPGQELPGAGRGDAGHSGRCLRAAVLPAAVLPAAEFRGRRRSAGPDPGGPPGPEGGSLRAFQRRDGRGHAGLARHRLPAHADARLRARRRSGVANAYNNANTLPNAVYDLMLGGILTSVVVPLLVSAAKRDADGGEAYDQRMFTLATRAVRAHRGGHAGRAPAGQPVRPRVHRPRAPPDGDLRVLLHPADLLLRGELAGRRDPQRAGPSSPRRCGPR